MIFKDIYHHMRLSTFHIRVSGHLCVIPIFKQLSFSLSNLTLLLTQNVLLVTLPYHERKKNKSEARTDGGK